MRCSSVFSRVLTARNCNWVFKLSASLEKVRGASIFEKGFKSKRDEIGGNYFKPYPQGAGWLRKLITAGPKCQRQSSTISSARREFPAKAPHFNKRPLAKTKVEDRRNTPVREKVWCLR
jgi:hypothetical protein